MYLFFHLSINTFKTLEVLQTNWKANIHDLQAHDDTLGWAVIEK